jgi:hypothetical protein
MAALARISALAFLVGLVPAASAQDDAPPGWLGAHGVAGFDWGSNDVPVDAVPRARDLVLPDAAYIGANGQDRPDDLELKGAPAGERRFLRYVHGVLVDAWWMSATRLDPGPLVDDARPDWTGTVLGPADGGFLAYGTASSWTVGARTVLHWHDRLGARDLLVSRAAPTPQYGIGRATPLVAPADTGSRPRLSGDFKKEARPLLGSMASCFDSSRTPVGATVELRLDATGVPSRIKVSADQPTSNLEDCVASALMDLHGAPNATGTLEMLRFQ